MKLIPLTQDKFAKVDDEYYKDVIKLKWHFNNGYACHTYKENGKTKSISMHRYIAIPPQTFEVDHINGDKLDNRKSNLRIVTPAQNKWNTGKTKLNTSGFKGVTWNKQHGLWQVKIRHNNKRIHVGYFDDVINAGEAYTRAAKNLYGEYAFNY